MGKETAKSAETELKSRAAQIAGELGISQTGEDFTIGEYQMQMENSSRQSWMR